MWRSTVLARIDAAERALDALPGEEPGAFAAARTELEAARESVLAAARAVEDDPALRARLELEVDSLSRLAEKTDETASRAIRAELRAARNRLGGVFGND